MCQVWSAVTGELVQSMRGHSGAVTGVRVLDTAGAGARVVSASSDCSVRVWSVEAGQCEASLYTYNTVTRLELLPDIPASVTTTDGGKIGRTEITFVLVSSTDILNTKPNIVKSHIIVESVLTI